MTRLPGLDLPGIPQHLVQRGNNRLPCFLDLTRTASQPVGAGTTFTKFVIPGLPEGEPGIQRFASTAESWIPGSIADETGDGPGMTGVESASQRQRGWGSALIRFLDDSDHARCLTLLREALGATDCTPHACVLMDKHVHLLVMPARQKCVAHMMQRLGRQYSSLFNARHRRSGTLWEGRYESCLVDSEDYVLRCSRYIDLTPVRGA